jgi:hypothetical protein
MAFVGLYMYDHAKVDIARGERKVDRIEYKEKNLLPLAPSDLTSEVSSAATLVPADTKLEDFPRRRSSSLSDSKTTLGTRSWGLDIIKEMTPPVTPRVMSPPPAAAKVFRQDNLVYSSQRRRYSQSQGNGSVDYHWSRDKTPREQRGGMVGETHLTWE